MDRLELITRLDNLIRRRATGSPTNLAMRLDVSERTVYYLIDQMKSLGAPVLYSTSSQSYYYENNVAFKYGFFSVEENKANIFGGVGLWEGQLYFKEPPFIFIG